MSTSILNNTNTNPFESEKSKVAIVGNSSVGKTSFLQRFIDGTWNEPEPTIGVNFRQLTLNINNQVVKTNIYDLSGNVAFRQMNCPYLKDCKGIFFIYDVSDLESFQSLSQWLKNSRVYGANQNCYKFLIANKIDLPEKEQKVPDEAAKKLATSAGMRFYKVSAMKGIGKQNPIREMINALYKEDDDQSQEHSELETDCSIQGIQSEERITDHEEQETYEYDDEKKIEEIDNTTPKDKKINKPEPKKSGIKSIFSNLFCKSNKNARKNAYVAKAGSN